MTDAAQGQRTASAQRLEQSALEADLLCRHRIVDGSEELQQLLVGLPHVYGDGGLPWSGHDELRGDGLTRDLEPEATKAGLR